MRLVLLQKWFIGIFLWLALLHSTWAGDTGQIQGEPPNQEKAAVENKGKPEELAAGYVIFDGRNLEPPYTVEYQDGVIFINGRKIDSGLDSSNSDQTNGAFPADSPHDVLCRLIKQKLQEDGLIIAWSKSPPTFFSSDNAMMILDALMSKETIEQKVNRLISERESSRLSVQQWIHIALTYEPERRKRRSSIWPPGDNNPEAPNAPSVSSRLANRALWAYPMTVGGIVLAVFGFGILMRFRPQASGRWREKNLSPGDIKLVVFSAGFLIVLNLFDLACTVLAGRSASFWEVNPMGRHLATDVYYLMGFKISMTLLAAGILVGLRHYNGAQIATWWLCVICTVLTLRWTVLNSFFMV